MRRAEAEALSRAIRHEPWEARWAMRRPPQHRVPLPREGDTVLFRFDTWLEPWEATVLRVQPLDDVDDPHLSHFQRDGLGNLLLHEGRPVADLHFDPWPTVWLKAGPLRTHTREARLRGSGGWLPLDWATRGRPLPAELEGVLDPEERDELLTPRWVDRFTVPRHPHPHQATPVIGVPIV